MSLFLFIISLFTKYFCVEFPNLHPMIVAVWHGETKPLVNEYIERFVIELKSILCTGIFINSKKIKVNFGSVICDTPARSLMKGAYLYKYIHEYNFFVLINQFFAHIYYVAVVYGIFNS